LELLEVVDVSLDSFPFGGGVTSLQAIAVGTPVLTLAHNDREHHPDSTKEAEDSTEIESEEWGAGRILRGRLTAAMYVEMTNCVRDYNRKELMHEKYRVDASTEDRGQELSSTCVASSAKAYVQKAVQFATGPDPTSIGPSSLGDNVEPRHRSILDRVRRRVDACAYVVFEDGQAVSEWEQLLSRVSRPRLASVAKGRAH
jgi:hypothetical protein